MVIFGIGLVWLVGCSDGDKVLTVSNDEPNLSIVTPDRFGGYLAKQY